MNGFFTILLTLVIAGVVSASEGVEARRGEKVVLLDDKSGFNLSRFRRVILYESINCKQLGGDICNYCSAKEKKSGCAEKSCSTFSFDIGEKNVSLTPLNNASDGCYRAKIFANDVVEKTLIIKANGPLLSTPSPESDPPPWEPTESYSTKGRDPPETESYSTKATDPPETDGMPLGTAVGIAVGIAAVIILVIAVVIPEVILICRRCKKDKHKQSEAGDDAGDSEENNSHRESISGAGEQARGQSFRMEEDGISHLADEDSLSEVLIDNTSMGQENERPGQHVQHNNYRDLENYCNRKNNKNDYEDSIDDSNYYSNDDSKNIPNSGDDDDDDDDNSGGDDDDDNSGDDDDDNSGGGDDDDDDDDVNSGGDDNDYNKPPKW